MYFQIQPLWGILGASPNAAVRAWEMPVQTAYEWIVANPQVHYTKARLTINSDWGEIGILTPSAFILPDKASPISDPVVLNNNLNFSTLQNPNSVTAKIGWGTPRQFHRGVTIDFIIKNDGSPIDIRLSHGSDGEAGGTGSVTLVMNGKSYAASGITTNNWNTKVFYQCEVLLLLSIIRVSR